VVDIAVLVCVLRLAQATSFQGRRVAPPTSSPIPQLGAKGKCRWIVWIKFLYMSVCEGSIEGEYHHGTFGCTIEAENLT